LERSYKRVQLVVLDLDAAAKWSEEGPAVNVVHDAPPNGIEEGVQRLGIVQTFRIGEGVEVQCFSVRLGLPNNRNLVAQGIINAGELYEMLRVGTTFRVDHVERDEPPPSNVRELADTRNLLTQLKHKQTRLIAEPTILNSN
jgi:hypothetical protein